MIEFIIVWKMIVTDMDDMEDIINTYNKQKEHKIYKGLLLS